jgi:hypothetical protein
MEMKRHDQLARQGSALPRIGLEPALRVSAKVARGVITGWMSRKHKKYVFKDPLLNEMGNYST